MIDLPPPPLAGLRVLDLTRYVPGPYATLLLAELGADVVKLEPPEGDPGRFVPPYEADGTSTMHAFLGRGKRSLALDLRDPAARAEARALALASDVVIESFRPGVMARLGLAPDDLLAAEPRLIVCSISGFGQSGPDRLRAGHDLTYLAYAGILGETGPREGVPVMPAVQVADLGGGAQPAVIAILAALLQRERTGGGAHLDVAMTGGAAHWLGMLHRATTAGLTLAPRGDDLLTGGFACYRCYETADGRFVAVASIEPKFFAALLGHLERPDLQALHVDPQRQEELAAELAAIFGSRPLAAWQAVLDDADCCVAPVLTAAEAARRPAAGTRGATPYAAVDLQPAPALGQHTEELLAQLRSSNGGSSASEPMRSTSTSA